MNIVEIRAQSSALPPGVTFELAWDEDGHLQTLRRRLSSSLERFEVEGKSRSIPRMRYVLLAREE